MSEAVRSLALSQRGVTERHLCPECSAERRNKTDRCLSVTVEDGAIKWCCHHCSFSGAMPLHERRPLFVAPPKMVALPSPKEEEPDWVYSWLATRGITRATAKEAGVIGGMKFINGENRRAVGFVYRKASKSYAVKWRATDSKAFTQSGSAVSLWRLDEFEQVGPLVICEGELDCLSLWQAGVKAVSVPNGAPQEVSKRPVDPASDRKFACLWDAKAPIEAASKIVIAVDADEPGNALGEEIARRVGRARCWKVLWPDGCKDANDVLRNHGADVLKECVDKAQPWPVKGLYDADHFSGEVDDLYLKGLAKGESTGYPNVDELYTIVPGQLCVVTGIPSMGKSSFVDQIMVNLAARKGWRFAICSFENPPRIHIAKLCQLYMGKPFFDGPTPRMTRDEYRQAMAWVQEHFVFLYQGDGALSPIEDIIDRLRAAVLRYGIRGAVVDPYNYIDRPREANETEWVSEALTKVKVFIEAHDVHLWLVAHPAKQYKREDGKYSVPGGYDISGSAHWFNKADMGMSVHRPNVHESISEVHIWKCRFNWIGKQGKTSLSYEVPTGRYFLPAPNPDRWDLD